MRVILLGGTRFIGRHISRQLAARGDEVTVVHRGESEPAELAGLAHIHADRAGFSRIAAQVRAARPDAVIDCHAGTAHHVAAVLPHLPDVQLVVLSSVDVYRAYELLLAGKEGEPLPITEESPVREGRFPLRGHVPGADTYDKLDVEDAYRRRGGTVLRLPMVYGEHDAQRREEFVLRRVRAGRPAIPVGPGSWLWTRGYAPDMAAATLLALGHPEVSGEVFNVGEPQARSILGWMQQILDAAGHQAELVALPESALPALPADLDLTREHRQHLLLDSGKIGRMLGWRPTPPGEAIARSVRWHLAHPPEQAGADFTADDQALAAAREARRD